MSPVCHLFCLSLAFCSDCLPSTSTSSTSCASQKTARWWKPSAVRRPPSVVTANWPAPNARARPETHDQHTNARLEATVSESRRLVGSLCLSSSIPTTNLIIFQIPSLALSRGIPLKCSPPNLWLRNLCSSILATAPTIPLFHTAHLSFRRILLARTVVPYRRVLTSGPSPRKTKTCSKMSSPSYSQPI